MLITNKIRPRRFVVSLHYMKPCFSGRERERDRGSLLALKEAATIARGPVEKATWQGTVGSLKELRATPTDNQ